MLEFHRFSHKSCYTNSSSIIDLSAKNNTCIDQKRMKKPLILSFAFATLCAERTIEAFQTDVNRNHRSAYSGRPVLFVTSKSSSLCVDELLDQVNSGKPDSGVIQELIISLSDATTINDGNKGNFDSTTTETVSATTTVDPELFEPLLGYYNVSYALTTKPKDNPVGGKWTRLWKVQRTLQHVLPAATSSDSSSSSTTTAVIAQVVNAIRLDLLWGMIGIWVLLRGDAVPLSQDLAEKKAAGKDTETPSKGSPALLPNLSDRTVRVYFDQPRIGIRLFRRGGSSRTKNVALERVLTIGPTSSVVLDTPYIDNRVRIGKGGTSGSQFVFSRLPEDDTEAVEGWKWVVADVTRKVLNKNQLILRVGIWGALSAVGYKLLQPTIVKWIAGASTLGSASAVAWLTWSTGGIETDGDTYTKGR